MNKFLQVTSFVLFCCLFMSCSKEETVANNETRVGSSTVVFFPLLETKGNRLVILKQGDPYTDQGAVATLNDKPATVTTTGTVNTAVPGIYILNYETKNPEGFSATDYRTVAVISNDIPAARDFSGTYTRTNTTAAQTSTWTKTATGVYTVVNPGGATGVTATAVNYTGFVIAVPQQQTSVGTFSSQGGIYNATAVPPVYQWIIINAGYGAGVRTFVKQ